MPKTFVQWVRGGNKWQHFFKRIHDLRVDSDLKQKDISNMLKVNINTYPHWESGMYEMPIEVVDRLSKFYNCSIDYLTGLSNERGSFNNEFNPEKMFIRIKRLRKESHLSQAEIGNILGFGQMNYCRYETGKILIPFSKLYLIAKKFNVSLDYLMGKTEDKKIMAH